MSGRTNIEWTDRTWNPVTGCNKVSPGCLHCYAEAITKRFPNNFKNGFDLTFHRERLTQPLKWRNPSKIFVNSMSDLFHEGIPFAFIENVFRVIQETPQHTYQILTKRPERLLKLSSRLEFHKNIWLGVSVENQNYAYRVDLLRQVPAAVRFLSCEPLLGELNLDLTDIHWVIAGGESGIGYRAAEPAWFLSIRDQCAAAQVAFFFKQWGGTNPKAKGNKLDGKIYQEFPRCPI